MTKLGGHVDVLLTKNTNEPVGDLVLYTTHFLELHLKLLLVH
jgi:hypothetical protein